MKIETDSTPLEEPKNPDTCNAFALYSLLASEVETEKMRNNYLAGNYGYGHAKQALFELICERFKNQRERFNYFIENKDEIEKQLQIGADKARVVAKSVLKRVREKTGY